MTTAPVRRGAAAGASVLALGALTACGTISDLLPGQDPFLDQSPRSIAKAGFADMREVTSMRVLGSIEDKDNGFTRVDIRLDDTVCTGTLDVPDGTIRVVSTAKGAWFSADDDFWRAQAGASSPQADRVVQQYAGKWVAVGKKERSLLDLCDLDALLSGFTVDKDDTEDSVRAGEVEQVGDADAVPVTGRDGKEQVTAWVSVDAPHRVLKLAPADDEGRPDALYFEEFGQKVVVEPPDKKDIVVLPGGTSV